MPDLWHERISIDELRLIFWLESIGMFVAAERTVLRLIRTRR